MMAAAPGGIRAGKAFIELGANDTRLVRGLKAAQAKLRAFGAAVQGVGLRMMAFGAAGLAPLTLAVKRFASAGDTLDKMSKRTGLSAEALSELGFAAEQSGANLEALEKGVRKMQQTILDAAQGTKTAQDAFQALGLTFEELDGLTPEEQFTLIGDRLDRIADPTTKAALAMEIFGRAGTQLLPLLQGGAAGMDALRRQARSLGLTVSTETAAKAALLTDTLNILRRVVKDLAFDVGAVLADAVINVANQITAATQAVNKWISEHKRLIVAAAGLGVATLLIGGALVGVGVGVQMLAFAFGGLAKVITLAFLPLKGIAIVLGGLASPVGLAVAALGTLGAAFVWYSDEAKGALRAIVDQLKWFKDAAGRVFGAVTDALQAGDFAAAWKVAFAALRVVWYEGLSWITDAWHWGLDNLRKGWADLTMGLAMLWVNVCAKIENIWNETQAKVRKAWEDMKLGGKAILSKLEMELVVAATKATGGDAEAVRQSLWGDYIEDMQHAVAENQNAKDAITSAAESTAEDISGFQQKALEEIALKWNATTEAIDAEAKTRKSNAETELENAKKELDEAMKAARDALKLKLDAEPAGAKRHDRPDPDKVAEMIARTTVMGTFSPFALRGLGADRPAEETAKNTRKTAEELVQMRHYMRVARAVFG
jgi:hypothetical protein